MPPDRRCRSIDQGWLPRRYAVRWKGRSEPCREPAGQEAYRQDPECLPRKLTQQLPVTWRPPAECQEAERTAANRQWPHRPERQTNGRQQPLAILPGTGRWRRVSGDGGVGSRPRRRSDACSPNHSTTRCTGAPPQSREDRSLRPGRNHPPTPATPHPSTASPPSSRADTPAESCGRSPAAASGSGGSVRGAAPCRPGAACGHPS